MADIIQSTDFSKWPVREFERRFYREVEVGGYAYLVPATKLGQVQITRADNARRDHVIKILNPDGSVEVSPDDVRAYVEEHRSYAEPIVRSWYAALWKPCKGSPSVEEVYEYIPFSLLEETQSFFLASFTEYTAPPADPVS
jgi:hypothetical protein